MCKFKWTNFCSLHCSTIGFLKISYFIVAHSTFTANFSSKLKSQFQVIFGQDFFPVNLSPFLASACFVVRYLSFAKQIVLRVFRDYSFVTYNSSTFFFHMPAGVCFWILPVWAYLWYLWISLSCILMSIAPVNGYIQWNSL